MAKAPDVGAKKGASSPERNRVPNESDGEPEVKAGSYMLKLGHPTPYRRTVQLDGSTKTSKAPAADAGSVQLLFEPGRAYELSEIEAQGCRDLIENGFLVPATTDEKGRNKPLQVTTARTDADSAIDKLEKKVEELAAENADLKAKLANAAKVTIPAHVEQK